VYKNQNADLNILDFWGTKFRPEYNNINGLVIIQDLKFSSIGSIKIGTFDKGKL